MKLANYKRTAAFLDLPMGTLYALVSQRRIPFIRVGRRIVRFDLDELQVWLEQRRQPVIAQEERER